jgi:hypothetical protein
MKQADDGSRPALPAILRDKWLRRAALAEALQRYGYPIAQSTLDRMVNRGNGLIAQGERDDHDGDDLGRDQSSSRRGPGAAC